MPIISALLPHALHGRTTRLKVAKVLFPKPRLLVHLDLIAAKGRRRGFIRRQRRQNPLGGLAGATVGRCEDLEGVVGAEEVSEAASGFVGLGPAFGGELDAVVWDRLVDFAVF